jgi:predicted outer membrane protein
VSVLSQHTSALARVLRPGRLAATIGACALLMAGPFATPAHAYAEDDWSTVVNTPYGPLGPADRDVLVRVRLAGLWEIPSGRMAQDHSNNARVKEVGRILESDHIKLDDQVRALAAKLNVPLPDRPNPQQQSWLDDMAGKSGTSFDRAFADFLRGAHGAIFPLLANDRAGTHNSAMREFAEVGVNVVMKHMSLLESTNDVNYSEVTPPPVPPQPRESFWKRGAQGVLFVWAVLAVGAAWAGSAIVRTLRPR